MANQRSNLNVFERASKFVVHTIEDMIDIVVAMASDCVPTTRQPNATAKKVPSRLIPSIEARGRGYRAVRPTRQTYIAAPTPG